MTANTTPKAPSPASTGQAAPGSARWAASVAAIVPASASAQRRAAAASAPRTTRGACDWTAPYPITQAAMKAPVARNASSVPPAPAR